jgi:hypothetical protein
MGDKYYIKKRDKAFFYSVGGDTEEGAANRVYAEGCMAGEPICRLAKCRLAMGRLAMGRFQKSARTTSI